MNIQKAEMLRLRLDGASYKAISLKAGVSRQRVQQILCPPSSIRISVVNRAGGKCESCHIFVGATGHVHHMNNDEDYNDLPNLQLLCPSCHRKAHNPTIDYTTIERNSCLSDRHVSSVMMGVRMPKEKAEQIKSRCEKGKVSINQWLTSAIDNQLRKR